MTFKPARHAPVIVAVVVITLVCLLRVWHLDFFERLERMTYDLRVKAALDFPAPVATNLAFVAIEESSLKAVQSGELGYSFGLLWPRQVYGRLVEELSGEGAKAVGFDVLFGELRPDHPPVQMADGSLVESDSFLAVQMRRASNVVLAVTPDISPPDLFVTNALALGDISTEKDSDGVLRRVRTFRVYRRWAPLIQDAARQYDLDLSQARVEPGKIVVPQTGTTNVVEIPIDAQTNYSASDFVGDKLPAGMAPKARAFTDDIVWHMGIVLAALQLGLDLDKADIDLPHGKIVLTGTNGVTRVIPVDANGYFYVDWRLTANDSRLLRAPIEALLRQDQLRMEGQTNGLSDAFRNKLVVVGSAAQGNNLADRGATPLSHDTLLVSKHWNVANSVIMDQFIHRVSLRGELALIVILGGLTAIFNLLFRSAIATTAAVFVLIIVYIGFAFFAFVHFRWWLPLVLPVFGAGFVEHFSLVAWRAIFEEGEKRRVKSIFSKVVAPDIVSELLSAEKLSLGGARREVTVFFADVRGFTAMTDEVQEAAAKFVRDEKMDAASAEAYLDESARATLKTVNTYLALVADTVIAHGGTLDKYIGDCVMAFWGAPVANPKHAVGCVRAAIETQRGIHNLNEQRRAENSAGATGQISRALLPILTLGCGVNTGVVDVGLMGSETHQYNYTAFGREVNLASRLEGVAGSARIIIGEMTYRHLLREDPALAATCIEQPAVKVKGFADAVKVYEVPWQAR
ncbi:MAG TPA: adenylate/guanylate cyclase domain-containing protein [Candidatus Saccharimonadales bacterium]|nr:adenylate/guanylate cyclase domain-containing protein [Candidatus Saccharimonadales bacterium]